MLTTRTTEGMGWRPDLPDYRDHDYRSRLGRAESVGLLELPPKALIKDLKKFPVIDQGRLGSCTGCSVGLMHSMVRGVAPRSALQIYYEARRVIGETMIDEGAYIRDAVKVVAQLGAGRESWWPYVETKFNVDPPMTVDRDALKRRVFSYTRLMTRQDFRQCLAAGFPFVIGFTVYDQFMSSRTAQSGLVPLPWVGERPQGGHAVCVVGYDSDFRNSDWAKRVISGGFPEGAIPTDVYIVRNSWGIDWGSLGNFAIDARYLEHPGLAGDAWTVRRK